MTIKHVIIHVIRREKDGDPLFKNLRGIESKGHALEISEQLIELFGGASLGVGEFGVNGDTEVEPSFEQKLKLYYSKDPANDEMECNDFVGLTQELANSYQNIVESKQLQSVKGGYLVFYHYTVRGHDWLAVAILNKTSGIDVSDQDLNTVARQILDLKKLHLAASINLTQWNDGLTTRYIRFKTGLAAEVRDYFEEYIGCQRDKLAATTETKGLKTAIKDFSKNTCELDDDRTSEKLSAAHGFIKEQQKAKQPVLLEHVANHVFPDNAQAFTKQAIEKHNLSNELAIDNSVLRTYQKISARSKKISISFDRDMLNKEITYNDGVLTITDIPATLRAAIEEELVMQEQEK